MKTIRQIADELGVSKQAVFKKMKREPLSTGLRGLTSTVDGRLMVSVDGENLIKSAFLSFEPSTDRQPVDVMVDAPSTKVDGAVDVLVDVLQSTIVTLQGQLEVKDKQLEVRDRQIEQQAQTITQLTEALAAAQQTAAAAQALHAGTIQQQLLSGEAGADQQHQEPEPGQRRSWFSRFFGN